MTERIAWLIDPDEGGLRHVSYREEVVRCRDCEHCCTLLQGLMCIVHGSAGWFVTDPHGFCWLAVRRGHDREA